MTDVIEYLYKIEKEYHKSDYDKRKEIFLNKRKRFNYIKKANNNNIERASLMIFLNKTCFNGLYRENKKGEFNVPIGSYKTPLICDADNLKKVSYKLRGVEIACSDYKSSIKFIDEKTFVYLDPSYRPISNTSSFNTYNKLGFNDGDQIELSDFVKKIDKIGAKFLLSNSDPKNNDADDNFFDELYADFLIERVSAKRFINSNSNKRGAINEILVTNIQED